MPKMYTQAQLDAAIEKAVKEANEHSDKLQNDLDEAVGEAEQARKETTEAEESADKFAEQCRNAKSDVSDKAEELFYRVQAGNAPNSFSVKDAMREVREALAAFDKILD